MKYVKGEILARDCKKTRPKSTDYKFPMKKMNFSQVFVLIKYICLNWNIPPQT